MNWKNKTSKQCEGGGEERQVKWLVGYLDVNRSHGGQSLRVKQGQNNGRKMDGMRQ